MTRLLLSLLTIVFATTFSLAQVDQSTRTFPDRANASDQVRTSAIETFRSAFNPQPSGILHVYIDNDVDPAETYLFRGDEASGTVKALLPRKYQEMAKRMNAKVYATKRIKGIDAEDFFLVRMDGTYEDRIEMFEIKGYEVVHVMTLATRNCSNGRCTQTDTWITDIDGDTDPELIRIQRTLRAGSTSAEKQTVYTWVDKGNRGKFKKSKVLAKDAPWSTIEFFEN